MNSFDDAWEIIYGFCRSQLSEVTFTTWFARMKPYQLDMENGKALISVPNEFHRKTINMCFRDLIYDAFFQVFQDKVEFDFVTEEELEAEKNKREKTEPDEDEGMTFDNFVVGPANRFAQAASMAVTTSLAQLYNPLFIYGHSGLGKTHLLYAIMQRVNVIYGNKKMVYIKGDDFTNEVIEGIRMGTIGAVREKYRQVDLFLVDDVQFIAGKNSTQEEFFNVFNTLYEGKKQIVLTSDRPPKEMSALDERLRTRFEWGLLADIQPPDFETRIVIILAKAKSIGISLPDNVTEFLALKLKSDVRQMEGAVKKLKAYNMLEGKPINLATAHAAILDVSANSQPDPITAERIIEEVAKTYSVTVDDLISPKRNAAISSARHAAMYIIYDITRLPMAEIGKAFGGRDHSTVVYALQQMDRIMKKDSSVRNIVNDIIKNIRSQSFST